MIKFLKIQLVSILLFSGWFANAQNHTDCQQIIVDCFRKVNQKDSAFTKGITFVEYSVKTTLSNEDSAPNTTVIKMFLARNFRKVVTADIEVIQDSLYTFTIVHGKKLIFWSDSDWKEGNADNSSFFDTQEKTISEGKIISCTPLTSDLKADKQVVLELAEDKQKALSVKQITYHVNTKNKFIHRTVLHYLPGSQVKQVEYVNTKLDYNYKGMTVQSSVKGSIVTSNGLLIDKFKGYKLVDNRKPTN